MSRSGSTPLTPATTGVARTCGSTSRSAVLEHQLVGVEDRQHAGQRAVALHAKITGVVDADQVDAAALDELGGDAVAGAGHHQAATACDLRAQACEAFGRWDSAWPRFTPPPISAA